MLPPDNIVSFARNLIGVDPSIEPPSIVIWLLLAVRSVVPPVIRTVLLLTSKPSLLPPLILILT